MNATDTGTQDMLPTYFISHGGGPWPWMKKEQGSMYDILEASLRDIPRHLYAPPKAVLMVSAHWEESGFMVMANPHPPMIYDYGGFPPHTYQVIYPAPGSPILAERVRDLIASAGFRTGLDPDRGFDHGAFAPLAALYPNADIPIVQLSIRSDYNPTDHLAMGNALAPLRREGVLIIGSGLSYHNLRMMGPSARAPSKAFDDWLTRTLVESAPDERAESLIHWDLAPAARIAHPREDHLLPLMVALGAARNEPAERVYHEDDFFGGTAVSSFRFGSQGRY